MKYLGYIITISLALIGGFIGYGSLMANSDNTKEEVKEVKKEVKEKIQKTEEKIEKNEEKIIENEKIDVRQSILIEQISANNEKALRIIEKLNEKLDK